VVGFDASSPAFTPTSLVLAASISHSTRIPLACNCVLPVHTWQFESLLVTLVLRSPVQRPTRFHDATRFHFNHRDPPNRGPESSVTSRSLTPDAVGLHSLLDNDSFFLSWGSEHFTWLQLNRNLDYSLSQYSLPYINVAPCGARYPITARAFFVTVFCRVNHHLNPISNSTPTTATMAFGTTPGNVFFNSWALWQKMCFVSG
jgi:hypothetical protein